MRILMIEDDAALCTVMKIALESAEIEVDFCQDGEYGLYLLKNHFYDVCCLDRMLPSMDGLTVLKNARAAKIATPVLMLTALARIDDRVDGLEAGADDYLAKPFDMRELIARLRALVRRPATVTAHDHLNFEDITLDPFELCLTGPSGTQTLSKKESEVLEALIKSI